MEMEYPLFYPLYYYYYYYYPLAIVTSFSVLEECGFRILRGQL